MNEADNLQEQQGNGVLPCVSGSALIAEFLGSKFINDAPEDYPNGYYYQPEGIECDCPTGEPDEWCFNSSWDWLMPVVEKIEIECKCDVNIYGHYNWVTPFRCTILDNRNKEIVYQSNDSKIQCVYDAVIEFIKWWNASLADR
jgi:hypothetical protein